MNERDKLIERLIGEKGGTREQYLQLLDAIAYHESAGTLDPTIKQIGGGPGRGKYQFEAGIGGGGITAAKRTANYYKKLGEKIPGWLKKITNQKNLDATKLSSEQQDILFLGNMREHPKANFSNIWEGKQSIPEFWANYHWAGDSNDKSERLKSFNKDFETFKKKEPTGLSNVDDVRARPEMAKDNTQVATKRPLDIDVIKQSYGGTSNVASFLRDRTLNSYNEGGTHDNNIHGGIPQGRGGNGKMNTVEQGETSYKFKDGKFIFSDRVNLNGTVSNKNQSLNAYAGGGMMGNCGGPGQPPCKDTTSNITRAPRKSIGKANRAPTDEEIAARRLADRIDSNASPLNKFSLEALNPKNFTREEMARASKGLESSYRVSDKPNLFDDYLNPAAMIGNMAANLGQAPLNAQQRDSNLPYVTAIAEPLLTGALASAPTSAGFVDNLINPIAGVGTSAKTKIKDKVLKDLKEVTDSKGKDAPLYFGVPGIDKKVQKIFDERYATKKKEFFESPRFNNKNFPLTTEEKELLGTLYTKGDEQVNSFVKDNHGFAMWLEKENLFKNADGKVSIERLNELANNEELVDKFLDEYTISYRGITIDKDAPTEIIDNALTEGGGGRVGTGNYSSNSDLILQTFSTPSQVNKKGHIGKIKLNLNTDGLAPSEKLKVLRDNIHFNAESYNHFDQVKKPIIEQPYFGDGYERVVSADVTKEFIQLLEKKPVKLDIDPDIYDKMGQYYLQTSEYKPGTFFLDADFYDRYKSIPPHAKRNIKTLSDHHLYKNNWENLSEVSKLVDKIMHNKLIKKEGKSDIYKELGEKFEEHWANRTQRLKYEVEDAKDKVIKVGLLSGIGGLGVGIASQVGSIKSRATQREEERQTQIKEGTKKLGENISRGYSKEKLQVLKDTNQMALGGPTDPVTPDPVTPDPDKTGKDFVKNWYNSSVTKARLSQNLNTGPYNLIKPVNQGIENIDKAKQEYLPKPEGIDYADAMYQGDTVTYWGKPDAAKATHEYTHALGLDVPLSEYMKKKWGRPAAAIQKKTGLPFKEALASEYGIGEGPLKPQQLDKVIEHSRYLSLDGELYPRIMEMRQYLNAKPGQKIYDADIKKLKKSDNTLFKFYTDAQIKEMLNTLAVNKSKTNYNNLV